MKILDLNKIDIIDIIDNEPIVDWGVDVIKAPHVWSKTKGEGVSVMVIDTGLDIHPDIDYKFAMNLVDRDYNFKDNNGHGTHVAGLIASKTTGVAPNVDLYIAKVLDDKGHGNMSSVMDGITLAINQKIDILCLSLGVKHRLPIGVQQRIIQAYEAGVTIVCAVGNEGATELEFPARMEQVIAVGGVDKNLEVTNFSNHAYEIDIVAPSVDILSTYTNGKYARMSGTSMASPLVAGGLALVKSYYRKKGVELSPDDIKKMITELGVHNRLYGYGVMDLTKLID